MDKEAGNISATRPTIECPPPPNEPSETSSSTPISCDASPANPGTSLEAPPEVTPPTLAPNPPPSSSSSSIRPKSSLTIVNHRSPSKRAPLLTPRAPPASLKPVTPPPSDGKKSFVRLTDFQKGMIASLHLEGHSIASIQRLLASWGQPRSYNTIKSFLDRWTTRGGDYSNDKATGRPKKLNREQREMIKEEVRKRGGIRVGSGGIHAAADMAGVSWEELRDELAPGVSTRTLKRVVKGDYDSDEGEKEQEKEENGESGKKGKKPTVKKRKIGTQLEYKLVIPEEQSTEDVMSETMVQEEWLEAPGEPSPAKRRKVVDSEEVQQDHEDYVGSEWDGIGGDHNVSQGGLDVQSIEMIMAIQRDMGGMSSAAINPHSS